MKRTKIIHLLCHLPNPVILNFNDPSLYFTNSEIGRFHLLSYKPYWVGFFAQDHHALSARELLNQTDEFEIECWRPYGYGLKEPHQEIVENIRHRVFPAWVFTIPQIGSLTWSQSLYNSLVKEIHNHNVILNVSSGHAFFHILLALKLNKYKSRFASVAIHRSGGLKRFQYFQLKPWKRLFKGYYFIEEWLDIRSLSTFDHYYVGAMPEATYLKEKYPGISSSFLMEGIDFSKYKVLTNLEKQDLRKELNLPLKGKILIAPGNWKSSDYEYQHLLECYRAIRKENADVKLLMIGGYKSEDLYNEGIESGAIMIERVEKSIFVKYLQASDFFTQANFSYGFINFGGFGTAAIEALACGLPIITNNIIHFPGTPEEQMKIGLDMPTKPDLIKNIIKMRDNLSFYPECREIACKYYNIEYTRATLIHKYRELEQKYFGNA